MSYRISKRADRDLDEIWRYIVIQVNQETADRVDSDLHDAMKALARMPGMGHRRPETPNTPYRFWKVYSYLIAYRVERGTVIVVRVIHGARDLRKLFRKR